MSKNLETVLTLFKNYGEGNIEGFLSLLHPDAVWIEPGDESIPYSGSFTGLAELRRFLGIVSKNQHMNSFKVSNFCEGDNIVVALGKNEATVFSTNKTYATDWVYAFTFSDDKIIGVKVYMDTLIMSKANCQDQ